MRLRELARTTDLLVPEEVAQDLPSVVAAAGAGPLGPLGPVVSEVLSGRSRASVECFGLFGASALSTQKKR